MTCFRDAVEQFVYDDIYSGINAISKPHCTNCSEERQPPETVGVFEILTANLPPCYCSGCENCEENPDVG